MHKIYTWVDLVIFYINLSYTSYNARIVVSCARKIYNDQIIINKFYNSSKTNNNEE